MFQFSSKNESSALSIDLKYSIAYILFSVGYQQRNVISFRVSRGAALVARSKVGKIKSNVKYKEKGR